MKRGEPIRLNLNGIYKGYLSDPFSASEIETFLRKFNEADTYRQTENRRWVHLPFSKEGAIKEVLIKEDVPLKTFKPITWAKNLAADSKLARSWQMSVYLNSRGFPTPKPIGLFEKRVWGILVRSYFLCEFLPTARSLTDFLNDPSSSRNKKEAVMADLIELVRTLHQHGLYHADLKGGNILVDAHLTPPKIYLVDFEASRLYPKINAAKKIKDLTRLNRALIGSVCQKERQQWMKRYLEDQKDPALRQSALLEKIEIRSRRRLIKKALSKGPSFLRELRYGIEKILVIKLRYIGDVLLTTPLLEALKECFPEASITALVNRGTEPVLFKNPVLSELLILDRETLSLFDYLLFLDDIRRKKFDLVVDLTDADRSALIARWSGAPIRIGYHGRNFFRNRFCYNVLIRVDESALHKIDHHLAVAEAMGHPVHNRELRLFLTPDEMETTQQRLNEAGLRTDQPFVVFHPGARRWYKSWPSDYFSELGNRISRELQIPLVLAGGPSDLQMAEKIEKQIDYPLFNLAGALHLRELACLLKMASLCVVNDSSPMHIAAAVGTPTIALFGLTDYKNWYPRGEIHQVFTQECPCRPYGHRRECDQGAHHCMRKISVEEVFTAVKARLRMGERAQH